MTIGRLASGTSGVRSPTVKPVFFNTFQHKYILTGSVSARVLCVAIISKGDVNGFERGFERYS